MGERYPSHIPGPMAVVLGMPPYHLQPWWMALREVGVDVPTKYEGEVAAALYFLIPFAVLHGERWRQEAIAELKRLKDGGEYTTAVIHVAPAAVVEALGAAVMALRSYAYGNSSSELAVDIADKGEAALKVVGLPAGFIPMEPRT